MTITQEAPGFSGPRARRRTAGSTLPSAAAAPAIGDGALLRVAGLSIDLWLAGAAPELFALVRELDRTQARYADLGAAVADRIGADLVPHPEVTAAQRRQALNLRRRLHRGVAVEPEQIAAVAAVARSIAGSADGVDPVSDGIEQAGALGERVRRLTADVTDAFAAEQERLLGLPWRLLTQDPIGRRMLADGVLAPAADVPRRLAAGEPWATKRMRRRSAYLWRIIARAATKSTPRTWLTHLALAGVDPDAPAVLTLPDLADRCAVDRVQNVQAPRRALAVSGELAPDTLVSMGPLRVNDGERARFWTLDPAQSNELRAVTVRHTALLGAVEGALDRGVRTVSEVETAVLGPDAAPGDRARLRQFIGKLATIGVVEPAMPPVRELSGWEPVGAPVSGAAGDEPSRASEEQFSDVYRPARGTVSAAACEVIEDAIGQLLRLQELRRQDHAAATPESLPEYLRRMGTEPRPVLEVFAEELDRVTAAKARLDSAATKPRPDGDAAGPDAVAGDVAPRAHRAATPGGPETAWRPAQTPGSGYDLLLRWIDENAPRTPGDADPTLRITPALLDRLGAPEAELNWPIDCTVRPTADGRAAVLDNIRLAGMLDARFDQALADLHGPLPHVAAYREFLAELDALTGVQTVELLIPPLVGAAANAVRRPAVTTAWTGDADLDAYFDPSAERPTRFVPLSALTVRRVGRSAVVEADGRPVRILYHSMRRALAPWGGLRQLTVDGGPEAFTVPRLRCPLVAMPGRDYLPRIAVGDALVLAPANWRLRITQLWDPADDELHKVRRLARLRAERGLPRFVVVHSLDRYSKPFPCDLESVNAVEVIERAVWPAGGPGFAEADVHVEEMLPAPGDVPVRDLARDGDARSAAEVMLRLPHRIRPAELAARYANHAGSVATPPGAAREVAPLARPNGKAVRPT